ncbi:MAG TPA: dethiobiotin synthase [bacterium]|nr:dethiobiotin synthase [bacterium]
MVMIYRGLCITGTDTGVGKTAVACGLAMLWRGAGLKVGALKPVETGCAGAELEPADGLMLARAAGIALPEQAVEGAWTTAALDDVAPWRFAAALAPEEAARLMGAEITVDRIYQAMDRWMDTADLVLVETAGGLMVPLNPRFTTADLMQGLELPALVVAPNRLGVINHALLTIEALRARDITPVAVVLNTIGAADESAGSNARIIRAHSGVPVFEVPPAGAGDAGAVAARALGPAPDIIRKAMETDWARIAARYINRDGAAARQGGSHEA